MQIYHIVILIFCLLYIVLDAVFHKELFEANHNVAKALQTGNNYNGGYYLFFKLVTQLGYAQIVGFFLLIGFLFFPNRIQSLKVLIYTILMSYILSLIKIFYHEPRPYFVYTDLEGLGCDPEFGKPSGHAMVTLVLYYLIFDSFANSKFSDYSITNLFLFQSQDIKLKCLLQVQKEDLENRSKAKDLLLTNPILMISYIVVSFAIGISRVILGAHGFHQVLLGWAYAIGFIVLYKGFFEKFLDDTLHLYTFKLFNNLNHLRLHVICLSIIFCFLTLINLISYFIIDYYVITEEEKITYYNNIRLKPYCSDFEIKSFNFLQDKCLKDTAGLSLVYAILISIIYTKGDYYPQEWLDNYKKLPVYKKILRVVVKGVIIGLPAGFCEIMKFSNIYMFYFFKACLRSFLVSYALVKFIPWALYVLKLDVEGDYLKINENILFFDGVYERDLKNFKKYRQNQKFIIDV